MFKLDENKKRAYYEWNHENMKGKVSNGIYICICNIKGIRIRRANERIDTDQMRMRREINRRNYFNRISDYISHVLRFS